MAAPPGAPQQLTVEDFRARGGQRRIETTMRLLFLGAATLSVVITALIVLAIVGEAWNFISQVDIPALWAGGWFPRRDMFDIPTIVTGTLVVAGIGMLVAVPLGLGAAIYLAEYASRRARAFLKPILEILAAVPSIVLGYFALQWISPNVMQNVCVAGSSVFNMGAAGVAVGVLVTPLIASIAEDAMYAVPRSLRGETMIVAIAAGGTGGSQFSLNPCQQGQTMTAAMTALATGSDQVRGADLAYPSLFFVGLLLFAFTLILNVVSERFVRSVRLKY
jgi:phosphate transport system permease protein